MAVSILGYFLSMIMVLTAAVGVMIGLFNFSTSDRVSHTSHLRPSLEHGVTATNSEPRLFMSVPDTKDASPAKNVEASSAAPDEKTDAKKSKPHKRKAIVRRRNNYEPGFGMGYAQYPQRPISNW